MSLHKMILIVEDSEEDFETAKRLLGKMTDRTINRCENSGAALAYLHRICGSVNGETDPWPDIILLDLNMPGEDGRSLLTRLKRDNRMRRIPIVILSTSANPKDLEYCYSNGAAGYIVKPVDLARFRTSLEQLTAYWLCAVTLPPAGAVS